MHLGRSAWRSQSSWGNEKVQKWYVFSRKDDFFKPFVLKTTQKVSKSLIKKWLLNVSQWSLLKLFVEPVSLEGRKKRQSNELWDNRKKKCKDSNFIFFFWLRIMRGNSARELTIVVSTMWECLYCQYVFFSFLAT